MNYIKSISTVLMLFCFSSYLYAAQLIEISVEITEINNQKAFDLGAEWVNKINLREDAIPSIFNLGNTVRTTNLTAELQFLQEKGAAQILSKPKLVTKAGSKAKTLVGGEFPVVTEGLQGSVSWKSYGIMMEILPDITDRKYVTLDLRTEVSRLDWGNQVKNVPAVVKRETSTSVEVRSGETIAIAGLIETKEETSIKGLPLLSNIPLLKYFFSHKKKRKVKNTVLIFVTPRIL